MRETFLNAVPAALRSRVARWEQSSDPGDEVGAIWERVARGTLVGAGFGRDLFELRDDPAATWVAAYSATSGDDPITLQLTTRAMYARFGEELLEPVMAIARECPPARQREIARAHLAAAAESGTPPSLRAKLTTAARWLTFHADGDGLLAEALRTLESGHLADAVSALVEVWRNTRDPALPPIIDALGEEPNPFVQVGERPPREGASDGVSDVWLVRAVADASPDPRVGTWLAPWVWARAASGRPPPSSVARLLVDSLPATRGLVDALGIVADDPGVTPLDPALLAALADAARRADPRVRALWAEVYANLADLGPRSVLADLYLQRGDPRGEFMAASIAAWPQEAAGLRKLTRRHEAAWLGALDALLGPPRCWRGGVLVGAVLHGRRLPWPPRQEWRGIEELRLADPAVFARLSPDAFPSLEVVGPVPARALPTVAQSRLLPQLTRVYVGTSQGPGTFDRQAIEEFPEPQKLVVTADWEKLGPTIADRPAAWWAQLRRAKRRPAAGALWPAQLP